MMVNNFNKRWFIPVFIITILSIIIAEYIPYWGLIFPLGAVFLGLGLLFGAKQLMGLLQPLPKKGYLQVIYATLQSFLIKIVLVSFIISFHLTDGYSVVQNGYLSEMLEENLIEKILNVLFLFVMVIVEELTIAIVTLSCFKYLSDKTIASAWWISNLVGSFFFAILHLYAYDFDWWVCFMIGCSRIPMTNAWKKTKSLRGGIYSHMLYNSFSILPIFFL